ncbi:isochorismatase family cysteine hydrolase [Nocardia terpenica]|uniref:cysteine hydrolase family protein n=1 Tax=Nocardia terpenica TaxID=455432 RepID=UPI002FE1137B
MGDTAVLMIDMQNSYVADDGVRDALGWPPIWRLDAVIAECAALLDTARQGGLPIVYSRAVTSEVGALASNPRARRHRQLRADTVPHLSDEQQQWRTRIMDAVAPRPGDLVLTKTRPSFFTYTELEPVLRSLGITRLVVAGLQTNVCVEATVRGALDRNFDVAVAEDAVSTDGPALHEGALNSMRVLYTEVAPWRELLAPNASWDRAFTTLDYGRDPSYWSEADALTPEDQGV